MSSSPTPATDREKARPAWVVAFVLLVVASFCGTLAYVNWPVQPTEPAPAVAAALPAAPAEPAAPTAPSFDVVRVGPQGRAVVAGRAAGGAEVTVRDGDRVLGKTRANAQGLFVVVPDGTLSPGARELTLSARNSDGTEVASAESVLLLVPEPPAAPEAPSQAPSQARSQAPGQIPSQTPVQATSEAASSAAVAVLLPPAATAAAPRVLDGVAPQNRKLGLDTVDYDERGEIRFAGSARPGTPLRLYVDNAPIGDMRADAGGLWTLSPATPVAPGVHRLRVDQLGADGKVIGRVELPFQRTASDHAPDADRARAIVQPGQNLWRIARQTYGQGTRYTVIYSANRDQIRDPNRIYPGQIFAVPPRS